MPSLTWSTDMSVGAEALDADHRALLDLVRRLDESVRAREPFEIVASLLTVATELTEAHIRREEEVLRRLGMEVDIEHAHAHQAFLTWSRRLRDDFIRTRDAGRVRSVMPVIRDWWHFHVCDQDMVDRPLYLANADRIEAILADSSLAEPILDSGPLHWPDAPAPVVGLRVAAGPS
ncbi:bacteriohemerythrin [Caenispirillum salinarum]|uniref:bacteriohemerythrin n=1 Tax=Caenispirillum salinarum TaxID=859058 RepID=UPI00384AB4E2